ncbi:MAG: CotH kinase family protein, partial [Calditrichia bacterium]
DEPLYVDTTVATVFIEIDPDSLAQIFNPDSLQSDHEYPAKYVFDNGFIRDSVDNIGFRLRGNTSRYAQKKSFKVSFNTFVSGRKFYGVEKFNLNGEHNDPSIIRSKLCWDIFREAIVPGSRASHVMLYINNVYYGLYINVEHIDENFVLSRFGNNDGNLYKCLWPADLIYLGSDPNLYKLMNGNRRVYELKTNKNADDYSDLASFIATLNLTPDSVFAREISRVFNVNGFLRGFAVDVAVGSWDDYWFLKNNYYLYHNTATGKFEYIPYDYDNTFGIWWDNILPGTDWGTRNIYTWGHPSEPRPLTDRILSVPLFRDRFSFYLYRLLERSFNPNKLDARIDSLHVLITPAAELDSFRTLDYGFTIQDFHNSYSHALGGHVTYGLKPFIPVRLINASLQLNLTDIAPIISEVQYFPRNPLPGDSIFITCRVEDEEANSTVLLQYQLDGVWQAPLSLADDGLNHDGEAGDEVYGVFIPLQSQVHQIRFYIDASDSAGNQTLEPMDAPQSLYSIHFGSTSNIRLFVNELMASNDTTIADPFGEFDDWIEIYNDDSVSIYLGDKFLTDNLANPSKWHLPDTTLPPGSFLLIWADNDENQGPTHTNFKLSKSGEQIGIFEGDSSGFSVIDSITYGQQQTDISYGRNPDGGPDWQFFSNPTPGYSNTVTSIFSADLNLPGRILL